ncbi:hypothetical protein M422DRAFT_238819 [Sphaerobolus stellatus SS14]|nr:hypothetical protein M422DRAFT_238819 [Sphaerobolus stellatus SS14]
MDSHRIQLEVPDLTVPLKCYLTPVAHISHLQPVRSLRSIVYVYETSDSSLSLNDVHGDRSRHSGTELPVNAAHLKPPQRFTSKPGDVLLSFHRRDISPMIWVLKRSPGRYGFASASVDQRFVWEHVNGTIIHPKYPNLYLQYNTQDKSALWVPETVPPARINQDPRIEALGYLRGTSHILSVFRMRHEASIRRNLCYVVVCDQLECAHNPEEPKFDFPEHNIVTTDGDILAQFVPEMSFAQSNWKVWLFIQGNWEHKSAQDIDIRNIRHPQSNDHVLHLSYSREAAMKNMVQIEWLYSPQTTLLKRKLGGKNQIHSRPNARATSSLGTTRSATKLLKERRRGVQSGSEESDSTFHIASSSDIAPQSPKGRRSKRIASNIAAGKRVESDAKDDVSDISSSSDIDLPQSPMRRITSSPETDAHPTSAKGNEFERISLSSDTDVPQRPAKRRRVQLSIDGRNWSISSSSDDDIPPSQSAKRPTAQRVSFSPAVVPQSNSEDIGSQSFPRLRISDENVSSSISGVSKKAQSSDGQNPIDLTVGTSGTEQDPVVISDDEVPHDTQSKTIDNKIIEGQSYSPYAIPHVSPTQKRPSKSRSASTSAVNFLIEIPSVGNSRTMTPIKGEERSSVDPKGKTTAVSPLARSPSAGNQSEEDVMETLVDVPDLNPDIIMDDEAVQEKAYHAESPRSRMVEKSLDRKLEAMYTAFIAWQEQARENVDDERQRLMEEIKGLKASSSNSIVDQAIQVQPEEQANTVQLTAFENSPISPSSQLFNAAVVSNLEMRLALAESDLQKERERRESGEKNLESLYKEHNSFKRDYESQKGRLASQFSQLNQILSQQRGVEESLVARCSAAEARVQEKDVLVASLRLNYDELQQKFLELKDERIQLVDEASNFRKRYEKEMKLNTKLRAEGKVREERCKQLEGLVRGLEEENRRRQNELDQCQKDRLHLEEQVSLIKDEYQQPFSPPSLLEFATELGAIIKEAAEKANIT